jgi:hypothetical protein
MPTTALTPANSMWVHPRDNPPDATGFVGSKPVLGQRWYMHTACFDATRHCRSDQTPGSIMRSRPSL